MTMINPTSEGIERTAWNRREFAEKWGLGVSTVDKLLREDRLGSYKIGARLMITKAHESAWLASMEAQAS